MAEVVFEGVGKSYGPVTVIEHLDLEIRDKELMVLVGPSGCGKSTALRMIAGLEEITGGEIRIGGRRVNELPPKDRDIAMVFQSYALYPHMTVRENLEFGLRIRKTPKAETDRLVTETASLLGLTPFLERKPKELSGGQRQRVAVGRAIVRKPSVFLFDEPLSNLDAKLRVQMRAEISKLQRSLQTTTVYVTHDQVEAMTMGHRIAIMKDGKLQQVGTPLEVYEQPVNLFVASFIGTPPMNFVPCTISEGGAALVASGFTVPVPAELRARTAGRDGRRMMLGLRPESLREEGHETTGARATQSIHATIELVEPLGYEVVIHGRVGDDLLIAKAEPHKAPAVGDRMALEIDLAGLQVFDVETEMRLRAA